MDILYSDSVSRNIAFDSFMFMPEISHWMVFVNGKHSLTVSETVTLNRLKKASNGVRLRFKCSLDVYLFSVVFAACVVICVTFVCP